MLAVFEAYQTALLDAKNGRFLAAAGMLSVVLAARPRHADTWLFRGVLLEAAGRFRDAYQSYATAEANDPDPARARLYIHHLVGRARREALRLESDGRIGEAAAILADLMPVLPDLAASLQRIARTRLADDLAEPPSPPQFALLHTWIVQTQMAEAQRLQASEPEGAAACLERLVALGIDQAELIEGLRNTARQFLAQHIAQSLGAGRHEAAAAALQSAMLKEPDHPDWLGRLDELVRLMTGEADRLAHAGLNHHAAQLHRRVLALAPATTGSRAAAIALAVAAAAESEAALEAADRFLDEGRLDQAVARYHAAIRAAPGLEASPQRLWRARRRIADASHGRLILDSIGPVTFEVRDPVTRLRPLDREPKGKALVSFFRRVLLADDEAEDLYASSVNWESREIVRIFLEERYAVDVVDMGAIPEGGSYDAVFAADGGLTRLPHASLKILYRTGSAPDFQNQREQARAAAFEQRRGRPYRPMRVVADPAEISASIERADRCILIGNERTRSTYPEPQQARMTLMRVSASKLGWIKEPKDYVPAEREFLWYFGLGAVLKGLDLVLDAVTADPRFSLNVVGLVQQEQQFEQAYHQELYANPRIRLHGHLIGNSPELAGVLRRSFCFVAPSASEGMSNAVATCLTAGLYPIISRETGIDLPEGCGIYLETCSQAEIQGAMARAHAMAESELARQIGTIQTHALEAFGRAAYARTMRAHLGAWLA